MKRTVFGIALLIAATVVGCATIMNGSDKEIKITTSPANAKVVIKNTTGMVVFDGKTPAVVKLSRNSEYSVSITMDGFKETTASITKQGIEGWFWGNIICGGIIGIVVDIADGAMNNIGPDEISVTMVQAHLMNGKEDFYALLQARDSKGELRNITVPMVKN